MLSIDPLHRREACQESGLTRDREDATRSEICSRSNHELVGCLSLGLSPCLSVGAVIDIISGFLPIPISCSSPRSIPLLSGGLDPKIRRDDRKVSKSSLIPSLPLFLSLFADPDKCENWMAISWLQMKLPCFGVGHLYLCPSGTFSNPVVSCAFCSCSYFTQVELENELAMPGSLHLWGAMLNRRLIDGESRDAMSEGSVGSSTEGGKYEGRAVRMIPAKGRHSLPPPPPSAPPLTATAPLWP